MKRFIVAALLVGAVACTDSNAPKVGQQPPPPPALPPPPPPASFAIRPALDTVVVGDVASFVAQRADSTVDAWTVSDSNIARIAPALYGRARATALARAAGTVTVKATRQGDSGLATLVIVPPPPFSIRPALDTVTVGQLLTFEANHEAIQWSFSDSSLARLDDHQQYWARVIGLAAGTVTVTASHQGDTAHATLVIREPQPGEWEAIELGLLDADLGWARAINDDGTIVGELVGPGGWTRGFIYKDGAMHKLPASGRLDVPAAISPSGKIAGIAYSAYADTSELVIWDTPDAAPHRLDQRIENVIGINDRGDVLITTWAGSYKYAPHFRGVLWRDNVRVDLGDLSDSTLTSPSTYAKAWNNRGQIVGWSHVKAVPHTVNEDPTEVRHPFLWENGLMRDLGVLTPLPCTNVAIPADCAWGVALDINAHGVVVGVASDAQNFQRAFIWENGVMRDLGVAPGHFTQAIAINDRGQVLGTVDGAAFLWENGETQIIATQRGTYPGHPVALGPNGEVVMSGAFIWQAGRLTDLGEGRIGAINSQVEVVGLSGNRAMLWRKKP